VGPLKSGQIEWRSRNSTVIFEKFPQTFRTSSATVSYDSQDCQGCAGPLLRTLGRRTHAKHAVHMDLPLDVHLEVMRFDNHINVNITIGQLGYGAQDGYCGDFNGQLDDAEGAAARLRNGILVSAEQLLFPAPMPFDAGEEQFRLANCQGQLKERATALCTDVAPGIGSVGGAQAFLEACEFDVCFGGEQYAVQDGAFQPQT